jgi:NADH:ubiquinone reductase (H+-translocating)
VVVLGGGFAGLGAARKLKDAPVDVVVIDRHDYHTFQPLLYQVATDLLDNGAVGHPLRDLFQDQENAVVHNVAVTGVDLERREVQLDGMAPLAYDFLVLALGAEVSFFGAEGAPEHAFPMYTLPHAVRLKEHILECWETADRDPGLVEDGALNIVVVGGGPTGVESVGALAELYRSNFAKDYPNLPQDEARLILVEAGPTLFAMFKQDIRSYTERVLEKLGVEVMTGDTVTSVTPTRVTLKSGSVLKAHTLVWGAGLQANPAVERLGVELAKGNRVRVDPDLRIPGRADAFAVGDIAWIGNGKSDDALPQLGSVALQSGEWTGENIARLVAGDDSRPFAYEDKGTMATIGRGAAVVQFRRGRTMKGKTAFLAWGAVHLALLSTGQDRTKAVVDWTWAGLTHDRPSRITVKAGGK